MYQNINVPTCNLWSSSSLLLFSLYALDASQRTQPQAEVCLMMATKILNNHSHSCFHGRSTLNIQRYVQKCLSSSTRSQLFAVTPVGSADACLCDVRLWRYDYQRSDWLFSSYVKRFSRATDCQLGGFCALSRKPSLKSTASMDFRLEIPTFSAKLPAFSKSTCTVNTRRMHYKHGSHQRRYGGKPAT